ncbi:sensor histidine kinase [Novosphingobium album (ex Hu et al. 2023)]|uniref:histidine kinase n=1 Tax=Novosphingobium album (ex Hu et al. 2023) TaxID=2930093 RepID=A0ABT0AYH0_9SPHN|nr:HAMP domain-containing sensor histidine kinase [Novosphingobium album (ex Hu et al. 2023)]MCJ2177850.1 HAMP domain-containing histidine kinase [Novosphingobium album (ex Hu et al. 2023)]
MVEDGTILARAESDASDRLLCADEPLSGLQLRCGGELPGTIAIPELLELVRKARRYGFRVARAVCAHDGLETVTAWVEVEPLGHGEGCLIRVRSWHAAPAPVEDSATAEGRRMVTARHLAELSAQLDAGQRVLAVVSDSPELAEVVAVMEAGIGQPWTDFLPLEDFSHQQPLHWRLLDGARVSVPGAERPWRATLIPYMQPGFEPAGFELLLLSDETAGEGAVAPSLPPVPLVPARRSLVGQDIAPVLKQPISRIIANAETIRTRLAGPLPEAYSEYAGEIASAGKLLLELLEDMADLEVVESEGFSTAPDRIDLSEVARQAAGILNVRAREKNIVIEPPHHSDQLRAIAEFRRVLQVLLNLIGNAIRYSPEHSHIWIRLEEMGGLARVIVADQGPGLSEEQQGKVFEKYERLGRSGDGGTGLGLYISRSLARAMGGELTVESAPGQGARFMLDVPSDPEVLP